MATATATIFQRIASGEKVNQCVSLLRELNYPEPKDRAELAKMLADATVKKEQRGSREFQEFLMELANCHPDQEFFIQYSKSEQPTKHDCGGGCGERMKNDIGDNAPAPSPQLALPIASSSKITMADAIGWVMIWSLLFGSLTLMFLFVNRGNSKI